MSEIAVLKAEARGESVSFEYREKTYTIDRDVEVEVLEDIEAGKIASAVKGLLGPEQYETFKKERPRVSDLAALLEAATQATGANLGESNT